MPQCHKYKCLNPNCPGDGKRFSTGLFLAMNDKPECPSCRAVKVEDWGEEPYGRPGPYVMSQAHHGKPGAGKRIDNVLSGIAERHGYTDMSNKDGKFTHSNQRQHTDKGKYGNLEVAGISVPINDTITTVAGPSGYKQSIAHGNKMNPGAVQQMRGHTQVVAEHKG